MPALGTLANVGPRVTDSTACAAGCGRPAPGATLCPPCTSSLRSALQLAAAIAGDLDDAIARQLRHGGSGKSASTEAPLPVDLRASDAAATLRADLARWVRVIAMMPYRRDDPWPADTIGAMAWWLIARIEPIRHHDHAAAIAESVHDAVAQAVRVLEPPAELHPAGWCTECGGRLLGEPDADTIECKCGHLNTGILAAKAARATAAEQLGDAEFLSRFLATIGVYVSGGTIRQWKSRGRIVERPGGLLAMSDVLAMVAERDSRKTGR